ncbi:MAG: FAD-binding oxidoreductase [Pseudomonadota bacterium]
MTDSCNYDSFGRLTRVVRSAVAGREAISDLASNPENALLPYGNGKSYGDSCHNNQGVLADMASMNRILGFDPNTGIIDVEPGVMLHTIIDLVAPHGWFLPVTPGTRFVTLGGAIANDVHGKNHHRQGTLGCHVEAITLLRSTGVFHLSAAENADLFSATIGGMGLTGIITHARLKLMRVGSPDVIETRMPFTSLSQYFERAEAEDEANEYAVAWLDQLNGERGVLMSANQADGGEFTPCAHKPKISVPFDLPFNALNGWSLRAFNSLFFAAKSRGAGKPQRASWQSYFYPLDAVGNWNRLYGPRGLFQHQSVIPFDAAEEAVPALLQASRAAGEASFLTVLKRFGAVESPGLLSFPTPGYTLTLDFPNRGASTLALLDRLDAITLGAGGRINPYKDARMAANTFKRGFPQWVTLEALRDPVIMSDFWRRTVLNHSDEEQVSRSGNRSHLNEKVKQSLTEVS